MATPRKKITAKKSNSDVSINQQEILLKQLHKKEGKKKVQRVTVDFPVDLYEKMKAKTEDSGYTLKGFIVSLVKKSLAEE